ncbi:MAG TPA: hypothetical protein VK745_29055 [Polyangiaceae bacterium]|nr:hypothetical protein [Polyangiaceae bacterium]
MLSAFFPAARAAAEDAGVGEGGDATLASEAGADNASADAGAPSSGGASGTGGGVALLGGRASYDLLHDNSGKACAIGHGSTSSSLAVILLGLAACALLRRRSRH